MAYTEIQTIAGDLRVTTKDVGCFLTVNDQYNLVWTDSRVTATGGVWEYNLAEDDHYIILPQAKLNVGLCVAIMRGKAPYPRDEGHGTDDSKANPKLVILPYDNNSGSGKEPNYDYIMGGPNFYCSSGIEWNEASATFVKNNMEWDEFSSVIFKSVYCGDGRYSWIIINGVGLWNAEQLDQSGTIYSEAKKIGTQMSVTVQTSSVNSLSSGVNNADTEFVAIQSVSGSGLEVKPSASADSSNTATLIPQCAVKTSDDPSGVYVKPNSFVIGRFTDDFSGYRNALYTEFEKAAVNIFGPKDRWNTSSSSTVTVNQVDRAVNYLGYVFDDTEGKWWSGNGKKSFSKRLGLRQKGTITASGVPTVGMTQVVVNVKLADIKLQNQKDLLNLRAIYCLLHSFFEISAEYAMPYTNVFKVCGNVFSAEDESISDSDIIVLTSSGLGETNSDYGYGAITQIPITSKDISVGSVNLVFEFIYRPRSLSGKDLVQCSTVEEFMKLNNYSNQYCLINFIGVEQLKSSSISPEVEFENFALTKLNNVGVKDTTASPVAFKKAYLDYNSSGDVSSENYVGIALPKGSYTGIAYDSQKPFEKTFFDDRKRFFPEDDITKTVIEYDSGFAESGDETTTITARLVIDWANRIWQFNSIIKENGVDYVCSENSTFSEEPASLSYYQKNIKAFELRDAIHIQFNGLYRLPWVLLGTEENSFDGRFNITHYKTVVHQSGAVETLFNYRCGWERAESAWTNKAYVDGSEWDGLISDYSNLVEGSISPSKNCIKPSHAIQTQINPIEFSRAGSPDDSNQPVRALLPYLASDPRFRQDVRYFCTQWDAHQTNVIGSNRSSKLPLAANDFCELIVHPKSTGTMICNIEVPVDNALSATGYLILKQRYYADVTEGDKYGEYEFIKDSGTNPHPQSKSSLLINFNDYVIGDATVKYTVIIYDTVWSLRPSSTLIDESLMANAQNTAILRFRPDSNTQFKSGSNDFRTLFNSVMRGAYEIPTSSDSRYTAGIFQRMMDPDPTYDFIDRTDFSAVKFNKLMFETTSSSSSGTGIITSPKTANMGATFSFHAYVVKEII